MQEAGPRGPSLGTPGNTTASATLNVSSPENSSFSYFTTVTVETIETPHDEGFTTTVQQKVSPTSSASIWESPSPTSTTTTTVRTPLFTRATEKSNTIPVTEGSLNGLDEVMKTTKIIIGCFVAITLMAAVMLIIFYKMRKQHHQQNHHAPTRTIEIINVDEDCVTGGPGMEGHLTLPSLEHEHLNHYNTYKTAYNHASAMNSIHSSAHEPLLIRATSKDNSFCGANRKAGEEREEDMRQGSPGLGIEPAMSSLRTKASKRCRFDPPFATSVIVQDTSSPSWPDDGGQRAWWHQWMAASPLSMHPRAGVGCYPVTCHHQHVNGSLSWSTPSQCSVLLVSSILSLSNPTNFHPPANIFNKYWVLAWVWSLVALLKVLLFAVSQGHLSPHRPCPWHTRSSPISTAKVPYCSSSSLCVSVHRLLSAAILAKVLASWVAPSQLVLASITSSSVCPLVHGEQLSMHVEDREPRTAVSRRSARRARDLPPGTKTGGGAEAGEGEHRGSWRTSLMVKVETGRRWIEARLTSRKPPG
ncbi:hypothetical protein CCH79_00010018 [Gambusia affinis]|uniref:Uncharacterized protein n=1 Tax=Gambusia affinis TaxID=33528 RepID=A0A315VZ27_GAMAF|nr:hypothetical protein CCH79_00010018 [Gambusia affinis]